MRSYTVFQFTQHAIENRSTCHAWHACRRLPTPAVTHSFICDKDRLTKISILAHFPYVKEKVKLSMCLIKHYAMKTYGGVEV
jgi:hypothetical protein